MNFISNDLTIILVLYEEKDDLVLKCLENIKNFKIIIIDNANNLNLKIKIEKYFHIEKYVLNRKNLGFTKAANQAIKFCQTNYILNINADCDIKEKDIFELINSHKKYKECFITSPTFYSDDSRQSYNAGLFDEKNNTNETLIIEGDVCVDKVLGSAILFKKSDIEKVNYLDDNFFMYFEDDDLCKKVKQNKMSVIQIFNSKAQHLHGQIKVKNIFKRTFIRNYHFTYDQLYYYYKLNKNNEKYLILKKKLKNYFFKMIFNFIIFRFNKSIYFFAIIKAFYDFKQLVKKIEKGII